MKKITLIIIFIHIGFMGKNTFKSLLKIERLRNEKMEKLEQINSLKESIVSYETDIKNVQTPFYKEKIARDRLQMILPEEKLYRMVEEKDKNI